MTTIAYRDGVIAADSNATHGDGSGSRVHKCKKLFRKTIGEGKRAHDVIIATAGESSPGLVFVDWYGSGKPIPDAFLHLSADFLCLVLTPEGLFEYDAYCRQDEVMDEIYAIGSGAKLALGAMAAGKSAVDAVRISSRYDPYTGGKIVSESLAPKAPIVKTARAKAK